MPIELPKDIEAALDDIDYVQAFQRLADLHQVIDQLGPNIPRLLQKAWMQMAVGDHDSAAKTAGRVAVAQPMNAEASFLQGEALLRAALVCGGRIVPGPGHRPERGSEPGEMLADAAQAFETVMRLQPGDREALARLQLAERLLEERDGDHAVCEQQRPERPPRPRSGYHN